MKEATTVSTAEQNTFGRKFRNGLTKKLVSLKRRPQIIPILLLCVTCMVYTFNLTAHSNAAIYVTDSLIALYVFIITLCSMLTVFSYMNAYSKGKRNLPMLVVCLIMLAIQIVLDVVCYSIYMNEITNLGTPLTLDVVNAINGSVAHLVFLAISTLAVVLLPVYHKLILKIPTQVDDEEGDNMDDDAGEISSEDDDLDDDDLD